MAASGEDGDSFSFCPSNDRLVDLYLRAKIDGKLSDLANAAYFRDADVCSARPQELIRDHSMPARVPSRDGGDGQQFYFFSPASFVGSTTMKKRVRAIFGTGKKESWHAEGRPTPVERSAAGGYMTKFSYHVRTGLKMVEKPGWIMTEYTFKDTGAGDTVLCKIYKSPRGPGCGSKRKAADNLEAATRSTRQRRIDENEVDVTLFAGDIERHLSSVEHHAATPEFGGTKNVEECQPEPQIVPASFDGVIELEQLQNWMMITETKDDGTEPQVPDGGEDFEAYHKRFWGSMLDDIEQQDDDGKEPQGYYTRLLVSGDSEQQDATVQT